MILRNVELDFGHRIADLRTENGRVTEIGRGLELRRDEELVEGEGGLLLPGLHDHHIHLFALAASLASVDCSPVAVHDQTSLREALVSAPPDAQGWIRGVGYHESVAGDLDRDRLDALASERPIRVQHRSGAMWFLNSKAVEQLEQASITMGQAFPKGFERDAQGRATGRLFREDAWMARLLSSASSPDLSAVGRLLSSYGVTGCSDATPTNESRAWQAFEQAQRSGSLPQNLLVMGNERLGEAAPELAHPSQRLRAWCLKILLDDSMLPPLEQLIERILAAHATGRGVAIHCVTRTQLLFALAAWQEAGSAEFDRIEHGSICPPEAVEIIARLGLTVVTQPNFVAERGDSYLRDVDTADQPWLYRCRGFDEAGIALGAGSDAPYGSADLWAAMRAAVDRRTSNRVLLGEAEALTPQRAVELFLTTGEQPGAAPRAITVGAAADLCLLAKPWQRVQSELDSRLVSGVWIGGRRLGCKEFCP